MQRAKIVAGRIWRLKSTVDTARNAKAGVRKIPVPVSSKRGGAAGRNALVSFTFRAHLAANSSAHEMRKAVAASVFSATIFLSYCPPSFPRSGCKPLYPGDRNEAVFEPFVSSLLRERPAERPDALRPDFGPQHSGTRQHMRVSRCASVTEISLRHR